MCAWLRSTNPFFFATVFIVVVTGVLETSRASGADAAVEAQAPPVRDQRIVDAAKMYEKYFLGKMMKAMRSTVQRSDLEKPSMGENIYREQLDDQYVDSWGERGGIGLADMIHDELVGKAEMVKLRKAALREAKLKRAARARGDAAATAASEGREGIALTDRDVLKIRKLPNSGSGRGLETVLVSLAPTRSSSTDGPEIVRSPWAGIVETVRSENGKVVLALVTDVQPQRRVEIAYDGVTIPVTVGHRIPEGQIVGHLAPGARGIVVRQTLVQNVLIEPSGKIDSPKSGPELSPELSYEKQ